MKKLLNDLTAAMLHAQSLNDEATVIVLTSLIASIKIGHQPILAQGVAEITKKLLVPALHEFNRASQN